MSTITHTHLHTPLTTEPKPHKMECAHSRLLFVGGHHPLHYYLSHTAHTQSGITNECIFARCTPPTTGPTMVGMIAHVVYLERHNMQFGLKFYFAQMPRERESTHRGGCWFFVKCRAVLLKWKACIGSFVVSAAVLLFQLYACTARVRARIFLEHADPIVAGRDVHTHTHCAQHASANTHAHTHIACVDVCVCACVVSASTETLNSINSSEIIRAARGISLLVRGPRVRNSTQSIMITRKY